MKKSDIIIIVSVVLLAGALYFSGILKPGEKGQMVVISIDGEVQKKMPLDKNDKFIYECNGKTNTIEVHDGYADCIDANCRDKLCVNQKAINKKNQTIVCLPHKMVISIEGGTNGKLDDIAN